MFGFGSIASLLFQALSFSLLHSVALAVNPEWTPIVVRNVTVLGPQHNPDVTGISRDGGSSILLNGNIIWLFDDTECVNEDGTQLSFVSNTASYAQNPNGNISAVKDFGVVDVGKDKDGNNQYAILADQTVGTGGWIPFQQDELDFNQEKVGVERVAIWPGTNPTPIGTESAFLYAPLVYVDAQPEDPSKRYQSRGMTLISVSGPNGGPIASRVIDLLFPGDTVPFGGFAAVLGAPSLDTANSRDSGDRDAYLYGSTGAGLQLARIALNNIHDSTAYTYYHPEKCKFTNMAPDPSVLDPSEIYLAGSFASGTVFYSPYFRTFLFVYLNMFADSTFYIRYLDLDSPSCGSSTWIKGGKQGKGIDIDDAEAMVWYSWSDEQTLYVSPQGKGGFNYAGFVHPEYFNRQYFSPALYDDGTPSSKRKNDWYGSKIISESAAGEDGKHLLLSWTSQERGGFSTGLYQVMLAHAEFDIIPANPTAQTAATSPTASVKPSKSAAHGIGSTDGAGVLRAVWVTLLCGAWMGIGLRALV